MTLSQATNNINWGNPGDQIYDGGPATTNSIHVTYQTIYFAPVGGGSATTIIRHAPSKTRKQFKLLKPMLFLLMDNNHHSYHWGRYYRNVQLLAFNITKEIFYDKKTCFDFTLCACH